MADCCECSNELLGTIKCEEFLDKMKNCYILKKNCAAWRRSVSK
jgi:hypothetical protein